MDTKVAKWGNSIGIRIPHSIAKASGIKEGSIVELVVKDSELIIKPKNRDLDAMIEKISPENQHREIDFGSAEGKELW